MSFSDYFDIAFCIPLLWGLYRGFSKGLIIELASLIALALGIYGAMKFSNYTSQILRENFETTNQYLPLISFALTFILIVIAVFLLAKFIETIVNIASLKLINKLAGAAFGLMKTGIIVFVLLIIVKRVDEKTGFLPVEIKTESFFYRESGKIPLEIEPLIKEIEKSSALIP